MKERPILMTAAMVRASMDDRKTNTRRGMKPQPPDWCQSVEITDPEKAPGWWVMNGNPDEPERLFRGWGFCPYGTVGDHLYVRESIWQWGYWEETGETTKSGKPKKRFVAVGKHIEYVERCPKKPTWIPNILTAGSNEQWVKRPAIFMPRWACRLVLETTGVKAERLQDISEEDAVAEGIRPIPKVVENQRQFWWDYKFGGDGSRCVMTPILSFKSLFEHINGEGVWDTNPWVWAIAFKRVTE